VLAEPQCKAIGWSWEFAFLWILSVFD